MKLYLPQIIRSRMTENREIAEEILSDGRMLLCMDLRFMTRAVMSAEHVLLDGSGPYSCDGKRLYYHADNLISDFRKNPNLVPRTIAHMILHLVLGHTSPDGDSYTNLAEDMVTEYALDMINTPNISLPDRDDRIFVFEKYLKKISAPVPGLLSGELKKVSEWQIRNYPPLFSRDSHSGRKGDCDPEWNELASQMLVEIEGFSRNLEGKTDALLRVLRIRTRKKHDFRRFLRKFMISRERAAENPDEFDPAYYTFGLARYGNIPLIDSTENSDSPSIEEFVIAIDTSGSTMRGPAFGFVNDVCTILEQCGVSGRTELHIVQCDNLVRTDDVIRCRSDLE
ncbi:MAG: hypothetical protein J5494_03595, partial [Candidatus Methanomethylophilaceae archaeon]|nr:hypothetical protein [Candidatus Methanomethylophilaceae archaeon]